MHVRIILVHERPVHLIIIAAIILRNFITHLYYSLILVSIGMNIVHITATILIVTIIQKILRIVIPVLLIQH